MFNHRMIAIKNGGLDLRIRHKTIWIANPCEVCRAWTAATGLLARRLWFFWEWPTDEELDLPDPGKVK